MNLSNLLLMAGGQNGQNGTTGILMFVLIIVIFYFFMIRPQTKKQKEEKKFREMLKNGQKVMTIGGVHGKIKEVKETTVLVEIAHDVVIEIEKTAIAMDASAQTTATAKQDDSAKK
ncbi:MAG: preprotein translocase subunit YajC [Bacteroidales bacterium]|nr:preprotein translocase subunit YajC [Bacteroidales bacterium]